MPNIVTIIRDALAHTKFRVYREFRIEGLPQYIRGEFTDPSDGVVWQIELRRLN